MMADGVPTSRPVRTTCPYCGVGCGVLATPDGAGGIAVKGDPDHPANLGRLCSKGSALGETVGNAERLLAPRIGGRDAEWEDALDLVATRFRDTIAAHGPDSVAFYVSGQLLTEDYYVANKLMKGFIGSANIDTNSRLCMSSTVAGHKRAFGTDTVPGVYEDLELADLVVLVGSNLAWCHPVLYQRLVKAKAERPDMKVVTIDPRRTATSDLADLHLAIAPGSDVALWNGLLAAIGERGAVNSAFARDHVVGLEAALDAAKATDLSATGLDGTAIAEFFRLWIATDKVVTVFSQGVNQSSSGTDKVNAIINCHLATGRIGKPGMGPFSVTGQPNAMGGREVGGLANMLACHLDLEDAAHRAAVREFWQAPAMPDRPGLKAVDMFRAVADGRIKALWIVCSNPAATLPDADAVAAAIEGCPFVVVSDVTAWTDTARRAHVLLPALGWGEKDGTVTNSDRTVSRQRTTLAPAGVAQADWRILAEVGARMGWKRQFDYQGPAEIFREYAALSGIAAGFGRDFDLSALAEISDRDYAALAPVRWPVSAARSGGRFFGDGRFFTADGRARMLPLTVTPPAATPNAEFPFRLNTGRVRDHWHTMTRTGLSPRLSRHLAEPFVEVHPEDAAEAGLEPAGIARAESPQGSALLRVLVTDRVRKGEIFAPIHWTGETSAKGRIDALIAPVTDPHSGQPESKAGIARLSPYAAAWYGFAASAERPEPATGYWALARTATGWQVELADMQTPESWEAFGRGLFGLDDGHDTVAVMDPALGAARLAFVQEGRVVACLFASRTPVALSRGQGEIRLEVADNGPGIAEKDRERVTERFVRLEASRSQPGSGLGLSMAKAAMRFHGGRLELANRDPGLAVTMVFRDRPEG